MNVPSVFRIFYLAFRMGPFLIVLYFLLYSLFNQDYSHLIYLMGVIMACFFGIITGGLWTSRIFDKPETVCHPLRLGTGERLSGLPLSTVVYVYTLCYFAVPMFETKTQSGNVLFLTGITLLIFIDLIWLFLFNCSSLFRMVVAGTVGLTVGLSWGEIVYQMGLTTNYESKDNSCMIPTPVAVADASSGEPSPKYICVKRKRTDYIPAEKEGLTGMTPAPDSSTKAAASSSSQENQTLVDRMQEIKTKNDKKSAPAPAPEPDNLVILSEMKAICTKSNKLLTGGLAFLESEKNQPTYSTIYDNLSFHKANVSSLFSSLLTESEDTITESQRIDYYHTFDAAMRKNVAESIQNVVSVEYTLDSPLYSKIMKLLTDLQTQYDQLPV